MELAPLVHRARRSNGDTRDAMRDVRMTHARAAPNGHAHADAPRMRGDERSDTEMNARRRARRVS
ncbi:hypothetical protein DIE07_29355 [Burkholderia sp. Bp9002]|nr:hypothetical protein DIE07_29355 [Burkholderia sp. Bp9002]